MRFVHVALLTIVSSLPTEWGYMDMFPKVAPLEKVRRETFTIDDLLAFKDVGTRKLTENKRSMFKVKTGGIIFYEFTRKSWILQTFNSTTPKNETGHGHAVSWCLDNTQGVDAVLTQSYELSLGVTGAAGVSYGVPGFPGLDDDVLSAAFDVALASGVTFRGAYSCRLRAGYVGRVYIKPHFHLVPPGREVKIKFTKNGLQYRSEWKDTPVYRRYLAAAPVPECVTLRDWSIC